MCGGGGGILGGIGKAVEGIGKTVSNVVSSVGNAVSSVAKNPIFQAVAPIALDFFLPGLGEATAGALGLSSAWAPTLGGALTGGALGALGGGGLGGALKGAAIGGAASGLASYATQGTNPLSGMFSEQAGGAANNALTAGGTGSTQLTGSGTGLGLDKSTIGSQFGINPNATGGSGGINFGANGAVGGLNAPSSLPGLGGAASSGGGGILSGLGDKLGSLMPSSTLGKVALGAGALSMLGGMGGQKPATGSAPPATPYGQDPTMGQHLQQLKFDYNTSPIAQSADKNRLNNYGVNYSYYNPKTGKFETPQSGQNANAAEYQFTNAQYSPVQQAGGGQTPYAMGGLAQYASGGMPGYADGGMPDVETDHGYLQGPGDGVSDGIPATIGDKQPARLAGGEFVIPSRIVSEIGNGSSDAGAKRLHNMMERINQKRLSSKDWAKDTKAYKELPA